MKINFIIQPLFLLVSTLFVVPSQALSIDKFDSKSVLYPKEQAIFKARNDNYHTYRIPAMVTSIKGSLLAFCEARKSHGGDSGKIDLVLKRSVDHGKSWSKQQIVWSDAKNCCGNPCPVVDQKTGDIHLLMSWNLGTDHEHAIISKKAKDTRRVFVTSSKDDGITWSKPIDITKCVKKSNWTWYATGPGAGIQVVNGKYKGRLIIPCDHIEDTTNKYYSHIIYSDDHGKSWNLGGRTPKDKVNECEVVELNGGKLMLNMRNYNRTKRCRQTAISNDGGMTWSNQTHDEELIEPICQASIRRYSWDKDGEPGIILFANPASQKGRLKMTVKISFDDAESWKIEKLIHAKGSAYSCLTVCADGTVALLYEQVTKHGYMNITFTKLTIDLLKNK